MTPDYFTLLILANGYWEPAFGDDDINVVHQEILDTYADEVACIILCSSSAQEEIEGIVSLINH